MLAYVHGDLSLVGWLIAAFCLVAAGYMAYLQNFIGCFLLLVVAVFAVVLLV